MSEREHGWEAWQWDETLFAGAASHYERGRLPYAPGLADAMRDALHLDGTERLLDVGCGPGTIPQRVAHVFAEVVGVDPDDGMIAEAARRNISNARFVRMRAEELPGELGTFNDITFAASFHWMDRPNVAQIVKQMLRPDGAVVQIDAPGYRNETGATEQREHPLVPWHEIAELRKRYLGPHTRAGQSFRNTSPSGEDDVFQGAGFLTCEEVDVPDGRIIDRTIDEIVANVFSSSSTAPHLFADRLGAFEADLRAMLAEHSPAGRFSAVLPANILRIWRLP